MAPTPGSSEAKLIFKTLLMERGSEYLGRVEFYGQPMDEPGKVAVPLFAIDTQAKRVLFNSGLRVYPEAVRLFWSYVSAALGPNNRPYALVKRNELRMLLCRVLMLTDGLMKTLAEGGDVATLEAVYSHLADTLTCMKAFGDLDVLAEGPQSKRAENEHFTDGGDPLCTRCWNLGVCWNGDDFGQCPRNCNPQAVDDADILNKQGF